MDYNRAVLSETKKSYKEAVSWGKREMEKIEKKERIQKELVEMINSIRKEQKKCFSN